MPSTNNSRQDLGGDLTKTLAKKLLYMFMYKLEISQTKNS